MKLKKSSSTNRRSFNTIFGVILSILTHQNRNKYVVKTTHEKMKHKKKNEKQIKVEMFGKWESFMYTV